MDAGLSLPPELVGTLVVGAVVSVLIAKVLGCVVDWPPTVDATMATRKTRTASDMERVGREHAILA